MILLQAWHIAWRQKREKEGAFHYQYKQHVLSHSDVVQTLIKTLDVFEYKHLQYFLKPSIFEAFNII